MLFYQSGSPLIGAICSREPKVEFNHNGTAVADDFTYQTAEPDIFVGGDVLTGPMFAVDAIAEGKQAAISIHRTVWSWTEPNSRP